MADPCLERNEDLFGMYSSGVYNPHQCDRTRKFQGEGSRSRAREVTFLNVLAPCRDNGEIDLFMPDDSPDPTTGSPIPAMLSPETISAPHGKDASWRPPPPGGPAGTCLSEQRSRCRALHRGIWRGQVHTWRNSEFRCSLTAARIFRYMDKLRIAPYRRQGNCNRCMVGLRGYGV